MCTAAGGGGAKVDWGTGVGAMGVWDQFLRTALHTIRISLQYCVDRILEDQWTERLYENFTQNARYLFISFLQPNVKWARGKIGQAKNCIKETQD